MPRRMSLTYYSPDSIDEEMVSKRLRAREQGQSPVLGRGLADLGS